MNKTNRTNHNNPLNPEFVMEIPEGYELVPENEMDGKWNIGSKFWDKYKNSYVYNLGASCTQQTTGCYHSRGYICIRPIVNKNTSDEKTIPLASEGTPESRLDEVFLKAFETNHPAMLDWVNIKFKLQEIDKLKRDLHDAKFKVDLSSANLDMAVATIASKSQEITEARAKVAELEEKAAVLQSQVDNADVNLEQAKLNYEYKLKSISARLLPIVDPMPPVAEECGRVWMRWKGTGSEVTLAVPSTANFYMDFLLPEPTPQLDLEQERREFEEYTRARKFYSDADFAFVSGQYQTPSLQQNWNTWQASAARNKQS